MLPLHIPITSFPSTLAKLYSLPSMPLHRRKTPSSSSTHPSNSIKSSNSFRFSCTHFLKLKPQKGNSTINCSSSSNSPVTDTRELPEIGTLLRRFWKVAKPYWSSEDKVQARLQLASVFALTLATTGISVAFSYLGRDFYNALANKDQDQFTKQLLYYLGAFAGGIPVFVLRDFAKETLSLRWRSWMTTYYMKRYLQNQSFYKIQSQSTIDNPDQRIVDDLSTFTGTALGFSLTLFNAAIDLISFSNILFGIYPPLFIVLLVYSIGGTAISIFLGKGLVTLNFLQEKKEADFRYGLVRVRENAESIAFYSGEEKELQMLVQRFSSAFQNLTRLLISSRNLEFFTNGYRYLIQILPVAVIAPMYFSGKIEFGVINQSVSAFNHILGDVSLIIYQFQAISAFSAVIDRLGEFDDLLDNNSSENLTDSSSNVYVVYENVTTPTNPTLDSNGSLTEGSSKKLVDLEHLTLVTPEKSTILMDLTLSIYEKDNLLINGPSGSGKTSLLRAMAGLWTSGSGKITFYVKESDDDLQPISTEENDEESKPFKNRSSRGIFFLPQKPYMVLGSLRQQLLYPMWAENPSLDLADQTGCPPFLLSPEGSAGSLTRSPKPTTEDLIKVLEDVRLGYLFPRFGLDSTYEWSSILSLGEQQRLAFARLLLAKPYLILLDESTSALDEDNEDHLYRLIEAADVTYVSIGHRRSLINYHTKVLNIMKMDPQSTESNWTVKPINQEAKSSLSEIGL
ncbi:hypothetical protein SOVF_180880 [Spinacia oleracea]|uniref:ABC transporter D family member 2, chloroplastic n=1 Tax=Spinacia oleracea TaxID=3562 RepID=A0A9R0JCB5_SPIOL|nr:ABC transporter D family member 2, chloroplastic [Spinacia oleracea]KNA06457.1 hypothetical protein SOVF_180880 [Spinacia oleracea]